MTLFHTSNIEIQTPKVEFSRDHLDFGKGFYLTSLREQAEKYGERFIRKGENAYLNIYELDEDLQEYSKIIFNAYDEEWLKFVTACRKGLEHTKYDIIEGGIADDQVFNTIDLYFAGIYTFEQALNQLQFKRPNHQICITNQSLLNNKLRFIQAIKL